MKRLVSYVVILWFLSTFVGGCSVEERSSSGEKAFGPEYWIENYVEGLNYPWSLNWLPNGDLLVTERLGRVKIVREGEVVGELSGIPKVMSASPYDGLLDIKLDPDFDQNSYLYFTYTLGEATARVGAIFRARLEGSQLLDGETIFCENVDVTDQFSCIGITTHKSSEI